MTTQKRRSSKKAETIDLGVIEMVPVEPDMDEEELSDETIAVDETKLNVTMSANLSDAVQTYLSNEVITRPRISVGVYKLSDTARTPTYATAGSACFDLYADFSGVRAVRVHSPSNFETERLVQRFPEYDNIQGVVIDSGERALIPTNLIFDIPEGWKMMIYARSGNALKFGMSLANSVGVVDHDYVNPTYIIVSNQSKERLVVKQGDRIAQAELVPIYQVVFNSLTEAPSQKTERDGGFGSTGQ
jgi:dUTP pyrophosphatase